jgi:predicted dehydrogenase
VEKPITETTEDARKLVELSRETGRILQVGHVERFNPVMSKLEELLTQPRFIEAIRLSPYPNRSIEIGVVMDLMIHDLEIILHLVRSPVKSIDAVGVAVLSRGEDIASVRLHFQNGCVANVTASRVSMEKLRKIRIFQREGYVSLDYQNQTGETHRLVGGRIVREEVEIEKGEPLKRELAAFVECARQGKQPVVSGFEGAAALELAVEITRRIEEHAAGIEGA